MPYYIEVFLAIYNVGVLSAKRFLGIPRMHAALSMEGTLCYL